MEYRQETVEPNAVLEICARLDADGWELVCGWPVMAKRSVLEVNLIPAALLLFKRPKVVQLYDAGTVVHTTQRIVEGE